MKNNFHLVALLLIALAIPTISCRSQRPDLTRVTVTGEALVQAPPDTAVLVLSVITQNQQALNAQQENARKSDAVIRMVQEAAGANPQIKTSGYSLQPQQDYRDNRLPLIIGYEARNTVTVTMSDLNRVGAVIDAASRAGANSVENVSFILRDGNQMRGQTLAEATRQAMTKAESIAQALGGRVVRVVEEHEGGVVNRSPTTEYDYAASAGMNSNASAAKRSYITPFETGSLNIKSQVQLVVEIEVHR